MPNDKQVLEQDKEGEASAEESGEWESSDEDEEEESEGSDDKEEVARHHALNADPSNTMTQRAGTERTWLQVPTRKSALGRQLRSRQRRSPSSPRLLLQRLGRLCRGSRWTSLLLRGEYLAFIYLGRLKFLF